MEQTKINKYVIFRIGLEDYGIPIDHVQAIERMKDITSIPKVPDYIKGIVDFHGSVIPVVDLRSYLKKTETHEKNENRILIIQEAELKVGFVVDRATEVLDISYDLIQPLSHSGLEANSLISIAKLEHQLIILLDIKTLLEEINPGKTLNKLIESVS